MKRWKALAGAAFAAALVIAPLTSVGAYAGEGDESVPDKVFICKYVGKPGVNETLQGGGNPVNSSISSIKGEFEEGHVIQVGDTFGDDHGRSVIIAFDTGQDPEPTIADCAPPDGPDEVIPASPVIHDQCGTDEDEYGLPANTDEVEYLFIGGAIVAHRLVGDGWGELPDGWVDNEDGGTLTWVGNEGDFTDEPCIQTYPVPAQFNAPAEPATCDAAGSFSTAFLGDREPIDGGEGWATYEYENVYIEVDRTVDGEVTLYIWPKDGYVISGTDGWTQSEDEDGVYYFRTILLPAQLSGPEVCPLASTPTPTPTPATPALAATGGPNMMPWGIGAAAMLIAGAALLTVRRLARR